MFVKRPKACFFAGVRDPKVLELIEFYRNDIKILDELGFRVKIATSFNRIPWNCDLYYSWWWGTGFQALMKARLAQRPILMVGNVRFERHAPYGIPRAVGLKRILIRMSLAHADAIITTSYYEHKLISRLRKNRLYMAYHGVDTNLYKPCRGETDENIIFTIANLYGENARRKRIREVIEAFKIVLQKYPAFKMLIAGGNAGFHDNTRQELESLTIALGIKDKVLFTGPISVNEKIRYYQKAKIFVQPSMYEGFGLAIAESMACGAPVVVCRVGAVPEVVGDCGVYVSGTTQSIADGMLKLLSNPQLRREMSIDSVKRIRDNFTYERRKECIGRIIEEVT